MKLDSWCKTASTIHLEKENYPFTRINDVCLILYRSILNILHIYTFIIKIEKNGSKGILLTKYFPNNIIGVNKMENKYDATFSSKVSDNIAQKRNRCQQDTWL